MAFYPVEKQSLVQEMRTRVVEIVYIMDNGEPRKTKVTLDKNHFSEESKSPQVLMNMEASIKNNAPILHAWDVENGGWRRIALDRIVFPPQTVTW